MTIDIANFYLNTPLTRLEYLKLKMREIPDEIIKLYNLKEKKPKMRVYMSQSSGECTDCLKLEY